ncbi:uncharacterized protein LOC142134170 [Mixophyes fleayi]|uniref:uncharacterized protein LOC142134170 n=1 Tax=Mixophyes fleayi TaxID=3061075 RepID=UPI003F4E23C5
MENQAVEGDEEESLSNAGEEPNGPKWSVVVRQKMQQAGMYAKHSLRTPMLSGFRDYLFETLGVIHNKQEVENVARYLYFMDPVNVSMDFVTNIEKTNLFFNKLRELGLCNQTIFNYLKNLRRFIGYKTTATNVAANDPPLFQACVHFLNVTNAIRKKLSKGISKERVVKRFNTLTTDSLQPEGCRRLLEVAKPEFLNCIHRASTAKTLTVKHQLNILYYLEALLILKHLQRPGVVANMTVEEWHKRVPHNFTSEGTSEKLVVVGVKHHKTATQQVATFALTEVEERWFDTYYTKVRPSMINEDAPEETFFISTSGVKIYNVSNDLRRFHDLHKLPNVTSQMARRACETLTLTEYSDIDKCLFSRYLSHSNLTANSHYRQKTLHNICLGSILVRDIGKRSDPEETRPSSSREGLPASVGTPRKDAFQKLLGEFPVTLEGCVPKSRDCRRISPSHWHYCRKQWGDRQHKIRVKHVITAFPARRPSVTTLTQYIQENKWKHEDTEVKLLVKAWKPTLMKYWKDCKVLGDNIRLQRWKGLKCSTDAESGVRRVTTRRVFLKGEVICDLHGDKMSGRKGRIMKTTEEGSKALFFYNDPKGKSWCINTACSCHTEPLLHFMQRSRKNFNVCMSYSKKFGVILVAAKDILAKQELKCRVE